MTSLTALILTFNERENIARTVAALSWVPHILVVDSMSTDGTLELVSSARPDARVLQREFDSFAGQCNYGLSRIETQWVLSIDADYLIPAALAAEMQFLSPASGIAGYAVDFRYCVYGRPLRSTLYPARTVLYQREGAVYEAEGHGHRVRIQGKVQRLLGRIDHDDRKPLSRWIAAQDAYTRIEASHLLSTPDEELPAQDRLRKRMFYAPAAIAILLLCGRGLVFDGWAGWFYVSQRTFAELLLSMRLVLYSRGLEGIDAPKGNDHSAVNV